MVGFAYLGSLSTELMPLNSIHSSANLIDIVVSLCAWLDAPQSPRGPSILSKLDASDDNLLLISFLTIKCRLIHYERDLCHEAEVDLEFS